MHISLLSMISLNLERVYLIRAFDAVRLSLSHLSPWLSLLFIVHRLGISVVASLY